METPTEFLHCRLRHADNRLQSTHADAAEQPQIARVYSTRARDTTNGHIIVDYYLPDASHVAATAVSRELDIGHA